MQASRWFSRFGQLHDVTRLGCPLPAIWSKWSVGCGTLVGVAYCGCCRSSNVYFAQVKAPDGLPAKASLCGICSRHWGDSPTAAKRRDQDHYEQWQHDAEVLRDVHRVELARRDESIAELKGTIAKLEQKLDQRPVRVVRENLDQEAVDQAHQERDRAQAARDAAYGLMAQFRGEHHDTGRGTCKCGVSTEKCEVTKILNSDRSFLRWETRQLDLVRRNGPYFSKLPRGHPALINPRWSPPEPTPHR